MEILIQIFVIFFGLILGSFFNVLIWRVPREESIIFPASHCPKCNRPIKPYENIPVLSYLFLKGKCAGCKARISIQYPIIELATCTALYFCWQALIYPVIQKGIFSTDMLIAGFQAISLLILIPIFIIDLHHYIIPDSFTLPGLTIAILLCFVPGYLTPLECLYGIVAGGGSLFIIGAIGEFIFKKEDAMGGGDIKMMSLFGALWGWKIALMSITFASLIGSIIGVTLLMIGKLGDEHRIPFGPFLAVGIWIAVFTGDLIITSYFVWMDKLLLKFFN